MSFKSLPLAVVVFGAASFGAAAQYYPPAQVPGGGGYERGPAYEPAQGSMPGGADAAGLLVRVDRLESQLRSLTGQIEQLQFQNRKLEEQLRRGQPEGGEPPRGGPQRRSDASGPGPAVPPPSSSRSGRGDAFDPNAAPDAPGAPRVIGSLPEQPRDPGLRQNLPQGPIIVDDGDDGGGPIDLVNPRDRIARGPTVIPAPGSVTSTQLPGPAYPAPQTYSGNQAYPANPGSPAPANQQVASLPPAAATPRGEFDQAVGLYKKNEFDAAETSFREFVSRYPTGQLTPQATYYLGETYSKRNRHREAAEQFLKVSTDFPKSSSVPQSLWRLGQSLEKIGAKEQACAAWGEVTRKYPTASASVRNAADRDYKRAQC
ncbi:tol-pal system protein YbgF [Roseiarcaceae bacterium H3SJ34-1]|uniref:tol-pal system protein YbgF n=1 Tax=Terripilifer ovatus TaxID=3032367 RepID=UPI003AB9991A|nr:tol-pal system protein YbgF [Roseiarcaceae bacterium H3SJ34-1]